jgi:hypothetical protein
MTVNRREIRNFRQCCSEISICCTARVDVHMVKVKAILVEAHLVEREPFTDLPAVCFRHGVKFPKLPQIGWAPRRLVTG